MQPLLGRRREFKNTSGFVTEVGKTNRKDGGRAANSSSECHTHAPAHTLDHDHMRQSSSVKLDDLNK